MYSAKQLYTAGTIAVIESDVDATSYQTLDDVDAASGTKVSYVVSSRTADGEVPQQQCVIESNGGESAGQTMIGTTTAVQVSLSVTGADATLSISGQG